MEKKTSSVFLAPEVSLEITDPLLTEGALSLNEYLNRLGAQHFIEAAQDAKTDQSGMQYILTGQAALSEGVHTAIVTMDCPFGNGIWPHLVARAEAVAEMAFREGLRDGDGNPIPVLLRAAPSGASRYGLGVADLARVSDGDPSPIAKVENDAVERLGFSQIYGDVNWSQSSAHTASRIIDAIGRFDIEGGVMLGDPPHARPTSMAERLLKFAWEGARFNKSLQVAGIDILPEILDGSDFVSGVLKESDENGAITSQFTKGYLERDLKALRTAGIPTTVVRAARSLITPRGATQAAIKAANEDDEAFGVHPVTFVEIKGTNHSYGDLIGHFGATAAGILVVNALLRSLTPPYQRPNSKNLS